MCSNFRRARGRLNVPILQPFTLALGDIMEPMNISVTAGGRDWRSSAPRPAGAFQASHSRFFASFLIHNPELETELTYTKQKVGAVSNRQENAFLKLPNTLIFIHSQFGNSSGGAPQHGR